MSCWNVFLNYGDDTFFIGSGFIDGLLDLVSWANNLWSSAVGRTLYLAANVWSLGFYEP